MAAQSGIASAKELPFYARLVRHPADFTLDVFTSPEASSTAPTKSAAFSPEAHRNATEKGSEARIVQFLLSPQG